MHLTQLELKALRQADARVENIIHPSTMLLDDIFKPYAVSDEFLIDLLLQEDQTSIVYDSLPLDFRDSLASLAKQIDDRKLKVDEEEAVEAMQRLASTLQGFFVEVACSRLRLDKSGVWYSTNWGERLSVWVYHSRFDHAVMHALSAVKSRREADEARQIRYADLARGAASE